MVKLTTGSVLDYEIIKARMTIESDVWNTLWLIQKALNEGRKKHIPVRIEVQSGSIESTIILVGAISDIAAFLFTMVIYINKRKEMNKPLEITSVDRNVAYAYVRRHLETEAGVTGARLVSENPTPKGGYSFLFEDAEGNRYKYIITNKLSIKYLMETK